MLPSIIAFVAGMFIMYFLQGKLTGAVRARVAAIVLAVLPMGVLGVGFVHEALHIGETGLAMTQMIIGFGICLFGYFEGQRIWRQIEERENQTPKVTGPPKVLLMGMTLLLLAYFGWVLLR